MKFIPPSQPQPEAQSSVFADYARYYDLLYRDKMGKQTKRLLNLQFESALTYGDWDINENWQQYRNAFLKGKEDERL